MRIQIEPSSEPGLVLFGRGAERGIVVQPGVVTLAGLPGLVFDYRVEVGLEVDPRPRAVVLSITTTARPGGPPVTARQVAREMGEARVQAVARLSVPVDRSGVSTGIRAPLGEVRAAMKSTSSGPEPVARADLERAADAYRAAQADGRPTGVAVESALRVTSTTARKRISQARKAGLLPPADGSTRPRLT